MPDITTTSRTPEWDSLWVNLHLATMQGEGYGEIHDGALAVREGRIAWVGPRRSLPPHEWAAGRASPSGPGHPRAQGRVVLLAQAASLGRVARLALRPWPPRRGAI